VLYGLAILSFAFGVILAVGLEQIRLGAFFALLLPLLLGVVEELLAKGLLVWHRRHAHSDCCEFAPAVRYKGRNGNEFYWEFRNRDFATAFCEINTLQTVQTPASTDTSADAITGAAKEKTGAVKEKSPPVGSMWQRLSRRPKNPLL
jgi:hypothetical protein